MADVAKVGVPSPATPLTDATDKISGLTIGEDIAKGDACYIKSDGLIWRSVASAAGAAAGVVHGYAATPGYVAQKDSVTLLRRNTWRYGSGLTPGANYYLSTTAGAIATATAYAGQPSCGYAIDTTRIWLTHAGS